MSVPPSGPDAMFLREPVKLESGLVQGVSDGEVTVYKGIPFAAPPIGSLRWRPPQPVPPWPGVLRADHFKPMCMAPAPAVRGGPMEAMSEDCLYLNIWTPDTRPKSGLPVIVWIYGGGFRAGSASSPHYWGDHLVKKGVVTVNLSYRVGLFGFFAHPELSAESEHRASGNYGIMDMVAALQWVRANIAAFGGDPQNVTIFGQSAGAFGVGYLTVSPLAKGLFHKAIGHSGADMEPVGAGLIPLEQAEASGTRLASALGASTISELRQVPAQTILHMDSRWPADANGEVKRGTIAVKDGYVLPDAMYDVYRTGKHYDVPILVGYNANDGSNLIERTLTASEHVESVRRQYGPLAERVLNLYPAESDRIAERSQRELVRDSWFAWPMWTWARLQSASGRAKAYLYHFSHCAQKAAEAVHGSELPYVFGNLELLGRSVTEDDRRVADLMSTYWTNFARGGDPNAPGLPSWPSFSEKESVYMDFGSEALERRLPQAHLCALKLQDEHADALRRATHSWKKPSNET